MDRPPPSHWITAQGAGWKPAQEQLKIPWTHNHKLADPRGRQDLSFYKCAAGVGKAEILLVWGDLWAWRPAPKHVHHRLTFPLLWSIHVTFDPRKSGLELESDYLHMASANGRGNSVDAEAAAPGRECLVWNSWAGPEHPFCSSLFLVWETHLPIGGREVLLLLEFLL